MGTDYRHRYIALVASSPPPEKPVRSASTVLVLRPAPDGFEVLTVRRARAAAFMGDARVFPGGALDEIDQSAAARAAIRWEGDPEELPWRAAALRELVEEAGIAITDPGALGGFGEGAALYAGVTAAGGVLDADRLVYVSNWITPYARGLTSHRFDTRFYAVEVPVGVESVTDDREVFDPVWVAPRRALDLADRGEWILEFPTLRHITMLEGFAEPSDVLDHFRDKTGIDRIEPRVVFHDDGTFTVLVPGEEGYEAAQP